MEAALPLLFAGAVGFSHAFEADHLVAVSNIVTRRRTLVSAIKDGIFWGLGHTSTIILIGLVVIVGKVTILNEYFGYFEAVVGLMLIGLGLYRLFKYKHLSKGHNHESSEEQHHHLAYGIGFVHGLAGSGAMILLVMTEIQDNFNSILYLLIFGLGSIVGMLLAAGIFSLPFSRRFSNNGLLQTGLIAVSSLLCIGYGLYMVLEHLN